MVKKVLILVLLVITHYTLNITQASAERDVAQQAQEEAEKIHKVASSDMIYTDEELKALYYQNIQIIELLKEIRSLLQQQLEKEG